MGTPSPALQITRPARRHGGWADLDIPRKRVDRNASEVVDELREDRL